MAINPSLNLVIRDELSELRLEPADVGAKRGSHAVEIDREEGTKVLNQGLFTDILVQRLDMRV